jgi:hypothetical protein
MISEIGGDVEVGLIIELAVTPLLLTTEILVHPLQYYVNKITIASRFGTPMMLLLTALHLGNLKRTLSEIVSKILHDVLSAR